MLSLRLDPKIEKRLTSLARRTGQTESDYVTKLIEENIEDMEDIEMAEARLQKGEKTLTHEQVRKELGLDN